MYELIASLIASTFPFQEMVQTADAFQLKTSLSPTNFIAFAGLA